MFSHYIPSLRIELSDQKPHTYCSTRAGASSSHRHIPIVIHYSERPAVSLGITWLLRALGSEGNVLRTHSTLKSTVALHQGLGETGPVHRRPWERWWAENFSESIPSYQVEREHVKYKGFTVLKNPSMELQFLLFKRLYVKAYL